MEPVGSKTKMPFYLGAIALGIAFILIIVILGIGMLGFHFEPNPDIDSKLHPDKRGFKDLVPINWSISKSGDLHVFFQTQTFECDLDSAEAVVTIGGSGSCKLTTTLPVNGIKPGELQRLDFNSCPLDTTTELGSYYRLNLSLSYTPIQTKKPSFPRA